eukprot:TRINITY_DN9221_c0_g1_i1.p1 TRINITY_DN9221_c0_g1~~TRINITY_DN9221_c0_g1_i1.p1  ORF type:complete len:146 (+),score=0.09 TRINITY_DN9221_c0_g1_i1:148-585(+)
MALIYLSDLSKIFHFLNLHMASPSIAETIQSERGKDKLVMFGFIYTLNRSTEEFHHWVCEKRGQCNARLTTSNNLVIPNPIGTKEIQETHTHSSDKPRIEMLKGYNRMKERASQNSEKTTRSIFASGIATMGTKMGISSLACIHW